MFNGVPIPVKGLAFCGALLAVALTFFVAQAVARAMHKSAEDAREIGGTWSAAVTIALFVVPQVFGWGWWQ